MSFLFWFCPASLYGIAGKREDIQSPGTDLGALLENIAHLQAGLAARRGTP